MSVCKRCNTPVIWVRDAETSCNIPMVQVDVYRLTPQRTIKSVDYDTAYRRHTVRTFPSRLK